MQDVQHVHLIGAGGIGISAIGKYLQAQGKIVTGSDSEQSVITDGLVALGIPIAIGHKAENVPAQCDLVVYTEAASSENPERAAAGERGIPQLGHFDFLGELSRHMRTVAIAGTNGKSTTTAMVGKIFQECGWDPTVFVGSLVPGWELGNLRIGKGDLLVVEADEYARKLLKLAPDTALITNIEEDHLDIYKDLDDIVQTFQKFAGSAKSLILNADDPNCDQIAGNRATFGFDQPADVWGEDRVTEEGKQSFLVKRNIAGIDESLGRIELRIPGAFNAMNALAATTVALSYGAPFEKIQSALKKFTGVWRRFERVGQWKGATIISDYGHHPTAVKGTLAAAKEFFPNRRIVLCFQPHQHNRTRELFEEFTTAFKQADVLILCEIYGVQGRTEEGEAISSLDLLIAIERRIPAGSPEVGPKYFVKDLIEAEQQLREHVRENDVIIIMGAGDVDGIARKLVG